MGYSSLTSGTLHISFFALQGEDSFGTLLADLTPVVEGTGPAQLLDVRQDGSAEALTTWLDERDQAFPDHIEVVSMDGVASYHSATKAPYLRLRR